MTTYAGRAARLIQSRAEPSSSQENNTVSASSVEPLTSVERVSTSGTGHTSLSVQLRSHAGEFEKKKKRCTSCCRQDASIFLSRLYI